MRIIIDCEIKKSIVDPAVMLVNVKHEGDQEWDLLFTFFPNEISFYKDELIGLSDDEANGLHYQRDHAYLIS